MYADDLFIMAATVEGLQAMLDCCSALSSEYILDFNCKKCSCVIVGPASKYNIHNLYLGKEEINWSKTFKYLGVNFIAGKNLRVDTNMIKRKFFASCNCILWLRLKLWMIF